MIRTFLKTPVVFSGFSRGVARIFREVRSSFSTSSFAPLPTPNLNIFFKMPFLQVGLTVISQSFFAVYEMTQPLKFLNSVGLLGSLTSTVYHSESWAIKNQACSTSDFSLQMTVICHFLSHRFWPTKAPHIDVIVPYFVYSEDRSWRKQRVHALHHQACYINKSSKIRFSN